MAQREDNFHRERVSILDAGEPQKENTHKRLPHVEVLVVEHMQLTCLSVNYQLFTKLNLPFLELSVFVLALQ